MTSPRGLLPTSPRVADSPNPGSRFAVTAVALVLFGLYVATLAPGVTFWDAGEFIAAIETLGIPHPPGTPLYTLLAHVWSMLLPLADTALETNLLSAACTAAAGGLTALLLTRGGITTLGAIAAALCAGAMATVWSSATETEVYAPALLLAIAIVASAERAGATTEARWLVLTAYLLGLAAALHTSALVAAPAAVVLAMHPAEGGIRVRDGVVLAGATAIAAGAGSAALLPAALGVAVIGGVCLTGEPRWRWCAVAVGSAAVVLIASTALLFLIVRAQHDPPINQGDPSTWAALVAHVARRQYAIAPLWPRQAPLWLQLANVFQYADWQIALGLAPGVAPSPLRSAAALAYVGFGVAGARHHRRINRRHWLGVLTLLIAGSVGVAAYLNLKAGPTIGHGLLPEDAPHEPRERDYFFALAFWAWGVWAGLGAWWLAARHAGRARALGIAAAALPIALNWRAVDRRGAPEALLPLTLAHVLLEQLPSDAVLFVWGDNDTYPLWYAQQVRRWRLDVTIITIPLLGAEWYRRELARRTELVAPSDAASYERALPARVATRARALGRPVAVSALAPAGVRHAIGDSWTLLGLVYVERRAGRPDALALDRDAARMALPRVGPLLIRAPSPSVDHGARRMWRLLSCVELVADSGAAEGAADSLDSRCNLR